VLTSFWLFVSVKPGGAPSSSSSTTPAKADDGLPPGWEKRKDEATGRSYYVDHNNKKTTWHKPTSNVSRERSSLNGHYLHNHTLLKAFSTPFLAHIVTRCF